MQDLPHKKHENILQNLIQIDCALQQINIDSNECRVRHLIDYRRQLLANLKSPPSNNKTAENSSSWLEYKPNTLSTELLQNWRSRVMLIKSDEQSFENPDFCNRILDNILPEVWNFDSDVMVVSAPPSNTIVLKAIDRNQRHIVIFDHHKSIDESTFVCHTTANIVVCTTIKDVEIAFAKLQTPAEQVITLPCSLDSSFNAEMKDHLAEAIRKGKKNRIANTITANKFGASWSKNLLTNLPLIAEAPNLHHLSVKGTKDAIIVASGPSLNKNVDTLATIQDKVFIVAALRSLPTLRDANIKPDLVIQLDAEDEQTAREFSTKLDIEIENFLIELTVDPWFLKSNVKNFIWSYPSIFGDIGRHFGIAPTPFDAPSVAIYGLTLCYLLGFESLCFIGQDLASSETSQYAVGATTLLPTHHHISTFNIDVKGFDGKTVKTRRAYRDQLIRCERIASELKSTAANVQLFNATEGGAYIKGFEHLSLSEFAKARDLRNNTGFKQIIFKESSATKPADVESYLKQIIDTMEQIIIIGRSIIELDTPTEINPSKHSKIEKLIEKFRCLNNRTSLLQIAMQAEISSVIGTSNATHNPLSRSEFFHTAIRHAEALKSMAEQSCA